MTDSAVHESPFGRLRIASLLDGLSLVILMGVGMPLKYQMDLPIVVRVMGPIHGVLFVWLCSELATLVFGKDWPAKNAAIVFLAALIPCGPFFLDSWIKKQELPGA
jgi:integral membrane protein